MGLKKRKYKKLGILGGTFDPPHLGHLKISKIVIKKLGLPTFLWAVTKKNPLKKKPFLKLNKRIELCKKLTRKDKRIKVQSFDKLIKSSKTINLLKYVKRVNNDSKIFFIIGSDCLVNFHKWNKWKEIANICQIVVFPRTGFVEKTRTCKAFKALGKQKVVFIASKRIHISSSKIRRNYLEYKY